jgi:hypothetical protein
MDVGQFKVILIGTFVVNRLPPGKATLSLKRVSAREPIWSILSEITLAK